ncbi:hypothetical protein KP806_19545 [Paenibacillus sp. N4]|uniref:hypothetical protein n=1 Tax=Paenibacillus vietnamensis TaxID=2590547 RepID=UPI001CD18CFA|nr:hypothetical protein [Paenibacillus vietnamensis]MCA0757260.1 hypothetical protein [Paenibacillus vietnamensis]
MTLLRKANKILLLVFLLLVISGYTNNGYKSIEEAIQHGGIKYKQIYHQHEVNNGIIVFYENPNGGIDAGIVYKLGDKYKWGFGGGTVPFPTEEAVTWGWVNLDSNAKDAEKQYQLYYGVIKETQISTLHIKHKGSEEYIDKDAEIIKLFDGNRLWFALQDKYIEKYYDGFILTGFNKDGTRVYHFD